MNSKQSICYSITFTIIIFEKYRERRFISQKKNCSKISSYSATRIEILEFVSIYLRIRNGPKVSIKKRQIKIRMKQFSNYQVQILRGVTKLRVVDNLLFHENHKVKTKKLIVSESEKRK